MDDDPTARVNKARALFRKVHAADSGRKLMGVHEFGTYATAAGFDVSMTDLVRARMALDPDGTQSVEPESFFTWLFSMLKSKKKSHLNKILTRTLVGVQTISNRDLPGEAHAYGKPVIRDGGCAANTMVEEGNEFRPSVERKPDRDWEAINKNFSRDRIKRRGNSTALDLKAVTRHDKSNMQYRNPYPTSRSRAPNSERLTGQFRHGGLPARYAQLGEIIRREKPAKLLPKTFVKKEIPKADYSGAPAGTASTRHLEPPMNALVEGRLHVYDNEKVMYPENTGLKRARANQKAKVHRLMHAPPTKASKGRLVARDLTPAQKRERELKKFTIKRFSNVRSVIDFKTGSGLTSHSGAHGMAGRRHVSAPEMRLNTGRSQDPMRDRLKLTARLMNQ
eukprot:INCI12947.1.p1 GENE.INCI12947.1~~INCI12947.1.p1  ORF type:complete len:393 (-),score=53.50 INCI12947.1:552-1730(-)